MKIKSNLIYRNHLRTNDQGLIRYSIGFVFSRLVFYDQQRNEIIIKNRNIWKYFHVREINDDHRVQTSGTILESYTTGVEANSRHISVGWRCRIVHKRAPLGRREQSEVSAFYRAYFHGAATRARGQQHECLMERVRSLGSSRVASLSNISHDNVTRRSKWKVRSCAGSHGKRKRSNE